jgi:hypothetical protein
LSVTSSTGRSESPVGNPKHLHGLLAPAVLLRPAGLALALWHALILRLTAPNKARGQRVSLPRAACVVAHTTILPRRHGLFNVTHRKKNVVGGVGQTCCQLPLISYGLYHPFLIQRFDRESPCCDMSLHGLRYALVLLAMHHPAALPYFTLYDFFPHLFPSGGLGPMTVRSFGISRVSSENKHILHTAVSFMKAPPKVDLLTWISSTSQAAQSRLPVNLPATWSAWGPMPFAPRVQGGPALAGRCVHPHPVFSP